MVTLIWLLLIALVGIGCLRGSGGGGTYLPKVVAPKMGASIPPPAKDD